MTVHRVPQNLASLVSLATKALAGATSLGAEVNLQHNTAVTISADLYDLTGPPGSDPTTGKQGQYLQKRDLVTSATSARTNAVEAGRNFCGRAIDSLKGSLGRGWNPRWVAAGFTRGTLAMPRDPVPLLIELRNYFRLNPTREHVSVGITAAQADALATAVQAAELAESTARLNRDTARDARDEARDALRDRLVGLRSELGQLIESDDSRWLPFGFNRPIDGRTPDEVTGLTLRSTGTPGEVIVQWEPAVAATSYRVMRQVITVDAEPVELGIITETTMVLTGLPTGKVLSVRVSARNDSGETIGAERRITLA